MEDPLLRVVGVLMTLGAVMGAWTRRLGVPRVSGYILAGFLVSPDLLGGSLGVATDGWTEPLTLACLGVIAYLIGGSMTAGQLRRHGRLILLSTLGEALGATLVVSLGMGALLLAIRPGEPLLLAGALGVIAATTAPATTLAVMHQYRVRGPLSRLVLAVVGLDDALGILLFAVFTAWVGAADPSQLAAHAFREIGGALVLGAALGWLLGTSLSRTTDRGTALPTLLGVILAVTGIAESLGASPLLACMALGFAARASYGHSSERLFEPIEALEEVVFVLFFTLAGSHFQLSLFRANLPLVLAFVLLRTIGKLLGADTGAGLGGAPPEVRGNLGFALLPQAGVAIGLALRCSHIEAMQPCAGDLLNVILAATLVHELVGPLASRAAFRRAGEIEERSVEVPP